jgi:HEPN domain-containing protein
MKPITSEWVVKAENDFATVQRESKVEENPNYDGICFHCQQCAEKYLKALLCEEGIVFGKVHDLVALLEQALGIESGLEEFREILAYLSDFAVSYRYPGETADEISAAEAVEYCDDFRQAARKLLGL